MQKLILLIDDDKLVLDTMTRVLQKAGHQVRPFLSAHDAIQEAMMEDFDLVIADIRMPEINGFQAIRYIREIRREKARPDAPEIFVTGYAEDYEEQAKKLAPLAIIHKPFELQEFVDVVNQALGC